MNRDEAKLILQVCRPGEADADPQLAAALALAKTDPELAAWYAAEQRWDAAVRRELKGLPVPADLKWEILARQRVREGERFNMGLPPKVAASPPHLEQASARHRPAFSAWRSPLVWAMAAALAIVLGLTVNWLRPQPDGQLADFVRDMIAASPDDAHHVDLANANFAQVKGWLADHQALADIDLPPAIRDAPGLMGCRIMAWHGRQVSMLCFMMKGAQHVDLFVTRTGAIADAPAPGQPEYGAVSHQMMAAWSAGGNVYMMTGPVTEGFLRHCLATPAAAQVGRSAGFWAED